MIPTGYMKCDYCGQPGIELTGESNGVIVCIDHAEKEFERDREREVAEVIWTVSRADEGTISATGANIVARALLARFHVIPRDES